MELDRQQWHVRWFFWSLGIWDEFIDKNQLYDAEHYGTNLCHFIRVTFVWTPLVILLHYVVYGAALVSLTAVPVYLFGLTFYVSLIIAIVVIVGIVWFAKKYRQRQEESSASTTKPAQQASDAPDFFSLMKVYIVATKQKVCPMITFRASKENVS